MLVGPLLALLFLTVPSTAHTTRRFNWDHIKYVYSFGDSYSYVQGTNGVPGFSFIGNGLNLTFTPEELLSNKIVPNTTSSGGRNWLELITGCFQGLPSECPVQLWDFSHGGSDIDAALLPPHRNTTVQMVDQVRLWRDYAADLLPRPEGKTLTTWWTGINDCTHISNNISITDNDAYLDADIEAYFRAVGTTARHGLRTHLFLTAPPVYRSPFAVKVRTGAEGYKKMLDSFNQKLTARMVKYARDNPSQLILSFDASSVFLDILDHPNHFGFNDTTTFCIECEDQEHRFWHTEEHPTEHVHRILAKAVEKYLRNPDFVY